MQPPEGLERHHRGQRRGDPGELYPGELAYAVDGIILLLMAEEEGARRKYLEVLKMRGTDYMTGKRSMDINRGEGIVVLRSRF